MSYAMLFTVLICASCGEHLAIPIAALCYNDDGRKCMSEQELVVESINEGCKHVAFAYTLAGQHEGGIGTEESFVLVTCDLANEDGKLEIDSAL